LYNEKHLTIKMIALGDKLSNVRAIYRDYQALGDKLWDRFNQKDKSEHFYLVYRGLL
ncbi:MAG: phosphohydrolase, partial [Clostridiales bacterium]|nr:phosphohydrolase [Clostridiales bacterium]